ncbi:MAG: hypothetical protein J5I62_05475 [Flavobacteriales bacterium]|nr:hypothetical protein [Flavobacteriales bacterium]
MQRIRPLHRSGLLALPLLLAFATGCKKPDKQVTYTATGYGSAVHYVDGSETWQVAAVSGYDQATTYSIDTVISGIDTTLTYQETVTVPGTWTYTFDAPHDGTARFEVIQQYYATGPTSASLQIDGITVASGTVMKYGDQLSLHD